MTRHPRSAIRFAIVAISFVCLGLTTIAAGPNKPLKGRFAGSGFSFDGHLTHLGRFTGEITSFTPSDTGGTTTAIWTAANGDEVHVISVFTITGFNPSSGLFTFHQAITIVGGTRRFDSAAGTAIGIGETAADFSIYDGVISGWISY
jgi:hypothetical protein